MPNLIINIIDQYRFRFYFWFTIYVGIIGVGNGSANTYHWPLSEYLGTTSSFCEFRSNHFHAGIDLRTSSEGMPVHAVADGHVSRINISATGYGKAIYITLKDGRIAVYAHLRNFPADIERLIYKEQEKANRYRVNFYLSSTTYPVKKGDVIAYSGSTGAGPAHLHFELRDSANRPLNPLTHGFEVTDTRPPVFYQVRCEPMNVDSYVSDEQPLELNYNATDGVYTIAEPLVFEGTVGLSIRVHDFVNMTQNIMAPYVLEMYCNNSLQHKAVYNEFSYDLTYQSDLEFDLEQSRATGVGFHCLYKETNNRLPFYENVPGKNGLIQTIDYAPGTHQIRVVARDVAGNEAVALIPFVIEPAIFAEARIYQNDRRWHLDLGSPLELNKMQIQVYGDQPGQWQSVTDFEWEIEQQRVVFDAPFGPTTPFYLKLGGSDAWGVDLPTRYELVEPEPRVVPTLKASDLTMTTSTERGYLHIQVKTDPALRLKPVTIVKESDGMWHEIGLQTVLPGLFEARYVPDQRSPGRLQVESYLTSANGYQVAVSEQHRVGWVHKNIAQTIEFEDSDIRLYFPSGSVRDDFLLSIDTSAKNFEEKFEVFSPLYQLMPAYVLLDDHARISLTVADTIENRHQLAVYAKRGKWWAFQDRFGEKGEVTVKSRKLYSYAVLRDRVAPTIRSLLPKNGSTITARRPTLKAWIYDDLSGIHQDDIYVYLDDTRVYAEYDVDQNYVFFTPFEDLNIGKHTVSILVKDRVGNEIKEQSDFTIR